MVRADQWSSTHGPGIHGDGVKILPKGQGSTQLESHKRGTPVFESLRDQAYSLHCGMELLTSHRETAHTHSSRRRESSELGNTGVFAGKRRWMPGLRYYVPHKKL